MASWKEGIDHTTGLDLANHLFVAKWGSNSNDGSSATPYLTITYAVSQASTGDTIVVYTGYYQEDSIDQSSKAITYQADGYVILDGNTNDLITACGGNIDFRGFIMRDYGNIFPVGGGGTGTRAIRQCVLFDVNTGIQGDNSGGGSSPVTIDCILINCDYTNRQRGGESIHNRNIVINSRFAVSARFGTDGVWSSYFDSDSTLEFIKEQQGNVPITSGETDYNNIQCPIIWDGTSYVDLSAQVTDIPTINANSINTDPLFSNKAAGDFSLQANSPHISTGLDAENIGGTKFGASYLQGSSFLDSIINSSSNLSYNGLGEIQVSSETLAESPQVDYGFLRYIGVVDFSGIPNINTDPLITLNESTVRHLTYEMRWAGNDGVFGSYRKFRWGEVPSLDDSDKSNGEDDYNWSEINKIVARKVQYRFKFIVGGTYNES